MRQSSHKRVPGHEATREGGSGHTLLSGGRGRNPEHPVELIRPRAENAPKRAWTSSRPLTLDPISGGASWAPPEGKEGRSHG